MGVIIYEDCQIVYLIEDLKFQICRELYPRSLKIRSLPEDLLRTRNATGTETGGLVD